MNGIMNQTTEVEQQQTNKEETSKNVDKCVELKNIEYQTMLLNKNSNSKSELCPNNKNNVSLKHVNDMLESEKCDTKLSWSRLNKTNKIKKIEQYIDSLKEKRDLSIDDIKDIKKYIRKCFDRKMLSKAKQICYDKNKEIITDIPSLIIFDKTACLDGEAPKKRFTMKLQDAKNSTLKNLSKGNSYSRQELVKKMRKRESDKNKDKNKN